MKKLSIIIPAYNEERSISQILGKIHQTPDFVNVSPKNHLQIMGRYVDVVS